MKKLLFVLVATFVAFAHAASFDWKTAKGEYVYGPGTPSSVLSGGTAYIFLASDMQSVFDTWDSGGDWTSLSKDSSSIGSTGKITTNGHTFDVGEGAYNISAFFATVYTDAKNVSYLYVSDTANATGPATGYETISFEPAGSSQAAVMMASEGLNGAGWYQEAPEPTSGLLLLLGFAGLALRRKRV